MKLSLFLKGILLFFSVFSVHAVEIHFPDEELATESVLPLVETPEVILNRNVRLKFRTELSLGLGIGLDEPFYLKYYPTGSITFALTESHAFNLEAFYFLPHLSSTGKDLKAGKGLKSGQTFDAQKVPYPQYSLFLNYLYTPYYGKISLAKKWVLNLSIYGFTGAGVVISNQNNQFPALDLGFGKKLYFNKWFGVKTSIGFYGYYGPAIARLNLGQGVGVLNYHNLEAKQKRPNINTIFHFGVFALL